MDIKKLNEFIPRENIISGHDYVWNQKTKIITLLVNGNNINIGKTKKPYSAQRKAIKWAKKIKKWDDKYNQIKKPLLMKKWKWELQKVQISKEVLKSTLNEMIDSRKESEKVTSDLVNEVKDIKQENSQHLLISNDSENSRLSEIEILKNELINEKKKLEEAHTKISLLVKEVASLRKENANLKNQIKKFAEKKVSKPSLIV